MKKDVPSARRSKSALWRVVYMWEGALGESRPRPCAPKAASSLVPKLLLIHKMQATASHGYFRLKVTRRHFESYYADETRPCSCWNFRSSGSGDTEGDLVRPDTSLRFLNSLFSPSVSLSGTSNSQLPLKTLGLKSQFGHLVFKYSSILSHPKSSYAVNVSWTRPLHFADGSSGLR